MSQAPEYFPEGADQPERQPRIIRGVLNASVQKPDLVTHSRLYPILTEKSTSFQQKVTQLAKFTFESYGQLVAIDAAMLPDDQQIDELVNFALLLDAKSPEDRDFETDLEMLDEAVNAIRAVSPIMLAEGIERLETQYSIPRVNTLVMKLWSFKHYGNPDDMPTHFDKAQAYCRDHPFTKSQRTTPGSSFLS